MPKRRSPDIIDMAETRYRADELKMTMDHEGSIYSKLQQMRTHVVKDSCNGGRVRESTMAVAFMPTVRAQAAKYKRQFGEGFTDAEMRETAREYVRETKARMNNCVRGIACADLPKEAAAIITSGRCTIPASGQFAGGRRKRRRR